MPSVALLYGLVALLLIGVHLGVAALTLRGSAAQPGALRLARRLLLGSWIASLVLAVADFVASPDYVHMFWSAQIPLVIAFLGSGTLLTTTWRDDGPGGRSAWWFLVVVVTLGVAPLLLLIATSGGPHGGRDVGEPGRRLFEVARWGLGGPLPECLAPITHAEHARGVGHLPREVTVPMGTFLIGAWLWIGFCTLALTGRAIPSALARRAWLATAPIVVGSMLMLLPEGLMLGYLDPRFFAPDGARDSGIWRSDPAVVRSFGRVLLTALAAVIVMALLLRIQRRSPAEDGGPR